MNLRFPSLFLLLILSSGVVAQEPDTVQSTSEILTRPVELNFSLRYRLDAPIDAVLSQIMLDAQLRKFANLIDLRDDDEIRLSTSDKPTNDPELVQIRKRLQKSQVLVEKAYEESIALSARLNALLSKKKAPKDAAKNSSPNQ